MRRLYAAAVFQQGDGVATSEAYAYIPGVLACVHGQHVTCGLCLFIGIMLVVKGYMLI